MKSLVIGGNGFVGSHLVDALSDLEGNVRVFDRFSDGTERYDAVAVERVVGDFMNVGELTSALSGIDRVFHFLSTTTPASAEVDPLIDVRTNVTGTIELLRACAEHGVKHVYFASTGGAIYGDVDAELVSEEAVTRPLSPYAIGKLTIEGYLRYFERVAGLRSTSFRISNPYGPRQHRERKQGVIPIFLRRALREEPLVVFGDGSMVRDYVYVADVARQIALAAEFPGEHPTYNVGSGVAYSLNQIVSVIRDVTGVSLQLEYRPAPSTYVQRVVLDTSRFQAEFQPSFELTPLRDGVLKTWRALLAESEVNRK